MVNISVTNPIIADCDNIHQIKDCLQYSGGYWKEGPHRKHKIDNESYLCTHDKCRATGKLLVGLIPKIQKYCALKGIELTINQQYKEDLRLKVPKLSNFIFRDDQWDLLDCVRRYRRGIIKSPTGSGKTVVAGAIISMLPEESRTVFLVHTKTLFTQAVQEFQEWFGKVGTIGDDQFSIHRVNVVMGQTAMSLFKKPNSHESKIFSNLLEDCDGIIIDECHHLSQENGFHAQVVKNCMAPVRIGLTATPLPTGDKKALVCEGFIGPIIGEFTLEEGIEKGILATPTIKLIPVPINQTIAQIRNWKTLYKEGIVNNRQRNRLIAKEAAEQIKAGKSVLIMVKDIVNGHAEQISRLAQEIYGIKLHIVKGATKTEDRERIKSQLKKKEILGVIASEIWREAVNIPSLDCVINACGYKSEIMTLQAIGRGLRTTEGKTGLLIIDFLDPYDYLAQHSIQRIVIYVENGWIK